MHLIVKSACLLAASLVAGQALANEELQQMQQNAADWVMPTGNYANWRYSELDQIDRDDGRARLAVFLERAVPVARRRRGVLRQGQARQRGGGSDGGEGQYQPSYGVLHLRFPFEQEYLVFQSRALLCRPGSSPKLLTGRPLQGLPRRRTDSSKGRYLKCDSESMPGPSTRITRTPFRDGL